MLKISKFGINNWEKNIAVMKKLRTMMTSFLYTNPCFHITKDQEILKKQFLTSVEQQQSKELLSKLILVGFLFACLFYNSCVFFFSLLKINDKLFLRYNYWLCYFSQGQLTEFDSALFVALSSHLSQCWGLFVCFIFFCEWILQFSSSLYCEWNLAGISRQLLEVNQSQQETYMREQGAPDWTQMY